MTWNEYSIEECFDGELFDWDEYQHLCDNAEYYGIDE